MKNVIITGATGMIGMHVAKVLLNQGVNVTAIVRPMSEKMRNLENLMIQLVQKLQDSRKKASSV